MRPPVVISSVNASFNTTNRADRGEPGLYRSSTTTTPGTRPIKDPLRVGKPQNHAESSRATHPKIIDRENLTERVPFPSLTSEDASVSMGSEDGASMRCPTTIAGDVVSQEGTLIQRFSFLKRIGAKLIMPPYTIDEGLGRVIAKKHGYINLNATITKLPLM